MKLKKRKKVSRMRGTSTHGWGARKKHISSGHRGGFGMAGTGKMAGQKKTLITKLYGSEYFGKRGITSKPTKKRENKVMNVGDIEKNLWSLKNKFMDKDGILNLKDYKLLGNGEIKEAIVIKARAASESAKEKIEKAGGKIIIEKLAGEKTENAI